MTAYTNFKTTARTVSVNSWRQVHNFIWKLFGNVWRWQLQHYRCMNTNLRQTVMHQDNHYRRSDEQKKMNALKVFVNCWKKKTELIGPWRAWRELLQSYQKKNWNQALQSNLGLPTNVCNQTARDLKDTLSYCNKVTITKLSSFEKEFYSSSERTDYNNKTCISTRPM